MKIEAYLLDGKISNPQQVQLEIAEDSIRVTKKNSIIFEHFYSNISTVEKFAGGYRVEIKPTRDGGVTPELKFENKEAYENLHKYWLKYQVGLKGYSENFNLLSLKRKVVQALILTVAAMYIIYQLFNYIYIFIPSKYDTYLGKKASAQMENGFEPCSSQVLIDFLETGVGVLSRAEDPFQYKIHLVNYPLENAFALPGGYIFMFSGLIEKSKSPEEVLGVLSHEMEHVSQRHGIKQISKSVGVAVMFSLTFGSIVEGVEVLEDAELISEILGTFVFLNYSRGFEESADLGAIKRLQEKEITVKGIQDFFHKFENKEKAKNDDSEDDWMEWLSTHPDHSKRVQWFKQAVAKEKFEANPLFNQARVNWDTLKMSCPEPTKKVNWKSFF